MKKKYVLKKWVKEVLQEALAILIVIAFITMIYQVFRITPEQEEALNYCMDQGYSKVECEKGLFGY